MKRLEVTIRISESEKIEELLKQIELLYSFAPINLGGVKCALYTVFIPDEFVDDTIGQISEKIDLRLKENTINVSNIEGFVSTHLDRLKERAIKEHPPRNPLERLVESTDQYSRLDRNILFMGLFAALVCLAGLFLDNVVIVIGAMLLSPLLGPINAFAVNANLGRIRKLAVIEVSILALIGSIIALSALLTFVSSGFITPTLTEQILLRDNATIIDILIAFILGCAGGLALFMAIPEMLVGVAVAVALLPPATVTGIGLALSDMNLFSGALILTLVNVIGLQFGGALVLRIKGVSPRMYSQKSEAKLHSVYSIIALAVLLLIFALFVIMNQP